MRSSKGTLKLEIDKLRLIFLQEKLWYELKS